MLWRLHRLWTTDLQVPLDYSVSDDLLLFVLYEDVEELSALPVGGCEDPPGRVSSRRQGQQFCRHALAHLPRCYQVLGTLFFLRTSPVINTRVHTAGTSPHTYEILIEVY